MAKPSYVKIVALAASLFAVGLFLIGTLHKGGAPAITASSYRPIATGYGREVQLVIANFGCACNKCNLPLTECTCDNPGGATEEKSFIRNKLQEGLTVEQVVQAVQDIYGHKTA